MMYKLVAAAGIVTMLAACQPTPEPAPPPPPPPVIPAPMPVPPPVVTVVPGGGVVYHRHVVVRRHRNVRWGRMYYYNHRWHRHPWSHWHRGHLKWH